MPVHGRHARSVFEVRPRASHHGCMITTSATTPLTYQHTDGGLRDPDPIRRARRLRAAGVGLERWGPFHHVVRDGEADLAHFRTAGRAERRAHAVARERLASA